MRGGPQKFSHRKQWASDLPKLRTTALNSLKSAGRAKTRYWWYAPFMELVQNWSCCKGTEHNQVQFITKVCYSFVYYLYQSNIYSLFNLGEDALALNKCYWVAKSEKNSITKLWYKHYIKLT